MSIPTVEVAVRDVRSPVPTAGLPDGAEAVVFVPGNPGAPATPDTWRRCSISSHHPAHIVAHNFGGP